MMFLCELCGAGKPEDCICTAEQKSRHRRLMNEKDAQLATANETIAKLEERVRFAEEFREYMGKDNPLGMAYRYAEKQDDTIKALREIIELARDILTETPCSQALRDMVIRQIDKALKDGER